MRFRQACGVLARAIEAAATLGGGHAHGYALCGILDRVERLLDGTADVGRSHTETEHTYVGRPAAARLAVIGGFTKAHAQQLREQIRVALQRRDGSSAGYLSSVWAAQRLFGMRSCDPEREYVRKARLARCAWLRTLGRSAPAKAGKAVPA